MIQSIKTLMATLLLLVFAMGCTNKDQLQKTIEENPEIILNAIEKHPKKFLDTLNKAVEQARSEAREDQEKQRQAALDEEFENPKQPDLSGKRVIFGPENAPITIVEYSDFECPFCSKGYSVMNEVKEKYGDKVRILYKHLPLNFHPLAMPAAQYYEAIALQSSEKAEKFHDLIFENQNDLKAKKEDFLKEAAKKVGADLAKVLKDKDSAQVKDIIKADMEEASKFGFSGTPGFLVNGVSVRGAYPMDHFEMIIDKHLEKMNK
ncbi:MAG: thioredoxin domain-containing protein [Bdellovibrionales bacterium]